MTDFNMQAYIDGLSMEMQKERSQTQMTLGKLIKVLQDLDPATLLPLGDLDSYRGYYSDLAFEPTNTPRTSELILNDCLAAMGKVFEGYKGGEYLMGESTPIWVANYGETGEKLIEVTSDGQIKTEEDTY